MRLIPYSKNAFPSCQIQTFKHICFLHLETSFFTTSTKRLENDLEKQVKAIRKWPKHRMLTRINQPDKNKLKAGEGGGYCSKFTLPGSRFYSVSSFAALWLSNHTSRSIKTPAWTLPKGQATVLVPTLCPAPCERRWIHLLGDIKLPWKDNVYQTAVEE